MSLSTTFDELYSLLRGLIMDYARGKTTYIDFIVPLDTLQQFPNKLYAYLNIHDPTNIHNSYGVFLYGVKIYGYISFDLKNKDDIDKFINVLQNQSYQGKLVGPNINGYSVDCLRQSMVIKGFGETFIKLYPDLVKY